MQDNVEETVAGAVFVGVRKWVLECHGERVFDRLVKDLPEEDRAIAMSATLVNTSRIPARIWAHLGKRMIGEFGLVGEQGYHAAAGSVAMADLSGYMKILMKIGTPGAVLARFPKVWKHYFSGGELKIAQREGNSGVVVIEGAEAFGDAALDGATGWMKAALQFAGARDVLVVRTKLNPADSKYQIRWR